MRVKIDQRSHFFRVFDRQIALGYHIQLNSFFAMATMG
ncbi:hypothetical protein F3D3_2720 [Fusibacter sp. 3D3]|nr:hypothetical protein F3D3_2720 [Fusibacter sp. 3D3]